MALFSLRSAVTGGEKQNAGCSNLKATSLHAAFCSTTARGSQWHISDPGAEMQMSTMEPNATA